MTVREHRDDKSPMTSPIRQRSCVRWPAGSGRCCWWCIDGAAPAATVRTARRRRRRPERHAGRRERCRQAAVPAGPRARAESAPAAPAGHAAPAGAPARRAPASTRRADSGDAVRRRLDRRAARRWSSDVRDGSGDGAPAFSPCPTNQTCIIMPLGDSITEGFPTFVGGYRVELFSEAVLAEQGDHLRWPPRRTGPGRNGPGQAVPARQRGLQRVHHRRRADLHASGDLSRWSTPRSPCFTRTSS